MSKAKGILVAFLVCLSIVAGPMAATVLATHGDTTGTVVDSTTGGTLTESTAIAGATVYAFNAADGTEAMNTTTATDGTYAMHLADGDYDIRVVADNFTVEQKSVTVAGATVVDFHLEPSKNLHDSTMPVSDDDDSVYVEITNSTDFVTFEFYGVDSTGTETLVETKHLNASATEFKEHRVTVDNVTYDEYRVIAEGTAVETLDVGLIAKVSGGGGALITDGGLMDWTLFGVPVVAIAALGLGAFYFREDL